MRHPATKFSVKYESKPQLNISFNHIHRIIYLLRIRRSFESLFVLNSSLPLFPVPYPSDASVGVEEEPVSGLALPPMDEGALMDDRDITLTGINEVIITDNHSSSKYHKQ